MAAVKGRLPVSRDCGMEACIQLSREIFLEGRLMHITLDSIKDICVIVLMVLQIIAGVRSEIKKK